MLFLNRQLGEEIVIGDDIVITVVDILPYDSKVRLGIEAPKAVPINRHEVHEAIQREKRAAALDGGLT